MSKNGLLSVLAIISLSGLVSCGGGAKYSKLQGSTMGTYYSITYGEGESCSPQKKAVDNLLAHINSVMSTYEPDSELSLINQNLQAGEYAISQELHLVLGASLTVWQETRGAFDVTIGPLVNLWGFGPTNAEETPTEFEQEAVAERIGMENLELASNSIVKKQPNLFIDLSAIAKGYAVDRVAEKLSSLGCKDYLVDIGGESFAKGQNRAGTPWKIGIEVPSPERRGIQRVLALSDLAIATSGDYRNFRETAVGRVSHVMDPRNKLPVTSNIVSATVLHRSAMMADAYATSMMVLGYEGGMKLAEAQNFPVYLLLEESGGRLEERYNDQMMEYLELDND